MQEEKNNKLEEVTEGIKEEASPQADNEESKEEEISNESEQNATDDSKNEAKDANNVTVDINVSYPASSQTISMDEKKISKINADELMNASAKLDEFEEELNKKSEAFKYVTNSHTYSIVLEISSLEQVSFYKVINEEKNCYLLKQFKTKQHLATRANYLKLLSNCNAKYHLLPIIDSGFDGDLPFDIIPLMENQSLANTSLSIDEIKYVLKNIQEALSYLHQNCFVHLNITPENIFYNKETKEVYLGDFVTKNHVNGTPLARKNAYLAPELYQGNISYSADYYALGITLISLIKGEYPFIGLSSNEIYKQIDEKTVLKGIEDKNLCNLISGLTLRDSLKRYKLLDIQAYLDNQEIKDPCLLEAKTIKEISKKVVYNDYEFKSKNEFGKYLINHWEDSLNGIKDGNLFLTLKSMDEAFVSKYKEICDSSSDNNVVLSKILIYFNLDNFIEYDGLEITSLTNLADLIIQKLPNIDPKLLKIIKGGILEEALSFQYNKTKDKEYFEALTLIQNGMPTIESLYYLIGYKYKTIPYTIKFKGKEVTELNDILTILMESSDYLSSFKSLFIDNSILAFLAKYIEIDKLTEIRNGRIEKTNESFYLLLEEFNKNGIDINQLIDNDFDAWILKNYKKYKYSGKEANKVKKQIKDLIQNRPESVLDYIKIRSKVVNDFTSLFHNDVYFDFEGIGITTKKYENYPIIQYGSFKVSLAYLKENDKLPDDYQEKFFKESEKDAVLELNKTKSEIDEAYQLYYYDYAELCNSSEFVKSTKIRKKFIISAVISIILLGIYGVLYFIPKTKELISDKYNIFDNYLYVFILFGIVPVSLIILLIPLSIKIRGIKKYKKVVNELVATEKYISNAITSLSENVIDFNRSYKKNKKSSLRISYKLAVNSAHREITQCSKYRLRKLPNKYLNKWFQRLYSIIKNTGIVGALLYIAFPILSNLLDIEMPKNTNMFIFIPLGISTLLMLLTFIKPKRQNISKLYYYLSFILVLGLSFAYFIFL